MIEGTKAMPTPRTDKKKIESYRSEPDDRQLRELIHKARDGDQRAFDQLVKRYRTQVAALAYRIVNDYDEAADIAQNVFVKMSKSLWRYDDSKKFYTWLYRITINAGIDHMRKHKRHRHEPLEHVSNVAESSVHSPEMNLRRRQLKKHIDDVARTLNDKQRSAFVLRDVEGCKVDDVASIMNMPEATVRWYLHRARAKIRRELKRRCPQLLHAFGLF
jgi:RNA polymerase sigma-70 factor (ECF subfamily)